MKTTEIQISHAYDSVHGRFALMAIHSPTAIATKLLQRSFSPADLSPLQKHTVTLAEDSTPDDLAEYDRQIKSIVKAYLEATLKNIHDQDTSLDTSPVREFLYYGDMNLGHPATTHFPEFLLKPNQFRDWMRDCFCQGNITGAELNVHRMLVSATASIVENGEEAYGMENSASYHLTDTFFTKGKEHESIQRLWKIEEAWHGQFHSYLAPLDLPVLAKPTSDEQTSPSSRPRWWERLREYRLSLSGTAAVHPEKPTSQDAHTLTGHSSSRITPEIFSKADEQTVNTAELSTISAKNADSAILTEEHFISIPEL